MVHSALNDVCKTPEGNDAEGNENFFSVRLLVFSVHQC